LTLPEKDLVPEPGIRKRFSWLLGWEVGCDGVFGIKVFLKKKVQTLITGGGYRQRMPNAVLSHIVVNNSS
jgi:hypothetical protein